MTWVALGLSLGIAGTVFADSKTAAPADKVKKTKNKPAKMSCEEFLALDESARSKLVYWAEGYDKKGKPGEATFDSETTDTVVPALVKSCQDSPKESFWKKAKAEFTKVF